MDRKSLEKMVEKIMSKLKEDSDEDPDSDFVHDDPQPSTSTGKGSRNKKNLKRLQKTTKKRGTAKPFADQVEERRKLFNKKNEKHGFIKSFRCLPKMSKDIPVVKPNDTFLLEKFGLWGRDIEFFDDDDKLTVKKKIESFFPEIIGGFKMLKSNKNGKLLYLIGDGPIVDGKELKSVSAKNIYLCPLQKDIEINEDPLIPFTDIEDEDLDDVCLETCVSCEEVMPMDVLEKHARMCRGKKADAGIGKSLCSPEKFEAETDYFVEPAAVLDHCGLEKIYQHREKWMTSTDKEAYESKELGNSVEVCRTGYVDDAIRLSKCPFFLSKLRKPLIVSFVGEAGVDAGGLRRNFLSMLADYGGRVFARHGEQVGLDVRDIEEIHFMLGVFLGIAIIQEGICLKYMVKAFNECGGKSNRYHPFIRGLIMSELDQILADRQVQSVFLPIPVTVAVIVASLDRSPDFSEVFQSPEGLMCANFAYNFFVEFLNNVADGKVTAPNHGKISLSDVFLFYTGSPYVPISWDVGRYQLRYKLNGARNRFRPSANTCEGCAQLTIPIVECYKDMEEGWLDAILSIDSGFTRA